MARISNPNFTSVNSLRRRIAETEAFLANPGHPLTEALRQYHQKALRRIQKQLVSKEARA